MPLSISMKFALSVLLARTGFANVLLRRYSQDGFPILMYHRVVPLKDTDPGLQGGMYVEPGTFGMHVEILRRHFRIVPLSEIRDFVERGRPQDRDPVCALTFDDGWSDFRTHAYPVLAVHRVPATVFLPTGFIGTEDSFWTDRLTRILHEMETKEPVGSGKSKSSEPVVRLLEDRRFAMETRLEQAIEALKPVPLEKIEAVLAVLDERWGLCFRRRGRDFLTWDQAREMHRSGLVCFGSHTHSHRILTTLGNAEIDEELRKSKERLVAEGVADPSFIPLAYPNGNYSKEIVRSAIRNGYGMAVTTNRGWVRRSDGRSLFDMNRIGIHQDMSSTEPLFFCRFLQIV